jgi:hypothetical protein
MLYADEISRNRDIGMYTQHYGQTWPAIVPLLMNLYETRFAAMPMVPTDWLQKVKAEHGQGDVILIPMAAKNWLGQRVDNLPAWLDTPARVDAWQIMYETVNKAVNNFASKKLAAGEMIVRALQSNAAKWDFLYTATKAVADAIAPYNPLKSGSTMQNALIYGGVAVAALLALNMFRK